MLGAVLEVNQFQDLLVGMVELRCPDQRIGPGGVNVIGVVVGGIIGEKGGRLLPLKEVGQPVAETEILVNPLRYFHHVRFRIRRFRLPGVVDLVEKNGALDADGHRGHVHQV